MAEYTIRNAMHKERNTTVDKETFEKFVKLIATLKGDNVSIVGTFDKDGVGITYVCDVYI